QPHGDRTDVVVAGDHAGTVVVGADVAAGLLVDGWLVAAQLLRHGRRQEHGGVVGPGIGVDVPGEQPVTALDVWWDVPADPGVVGPDGRAEQVQGGPGHRAAVLDGAADQLGDRQVP